MNPERPQQALPTESTAPDHAVAAALTFFARSVAGDGVNVAYASGTATITGHVASAKHAEALVDLIRWHDGVGRVESELSIGVPAPVHHSN